MSFTLSVDLLSSILAALFAATVLIYRPKDLYARAFALNNQSSVASTRLSDESAVYRHRACPHGSYLVTVSVGNQLNTLEKLVLSDAFTKGQLAVVSHSTKIKWRSMENIQSDAFKLGEWLKVHGNIQPQAEVVMIMLDNENGEEWFVCDIACQTYNFIQMTVSPAIDGATLHRLFASLLVSIVIGKSAQLTRVEHITKVMKKAIDKPIVMIDISEEKSTFVQYSDIMRGTKVTAFVSPSIKPSDLMMLYLPTQTNNLHSTTTDMTYIGATEVITVTRKCLLSAVSAIQHATPFGVRPMVGQLILNTLPLSHPVSRVLTYYFLYHSASVALASSSTTVTDLGISPNYMVMSSTAMSSLALNISKRVSGLASLILHYRMTEMKRTRIVPDLMDDTFLERTILSGVRHVLGGQLKQIFHTGDTFKNLGVYVDHVDLLLALGVNVTQLWGSTSTLHLSTMTTLWDGQSRRYQNGINVGAVLPHIEMKLMQKGFSDQSPSGDVTVRGMGVCETKIKLLNDVDNDQDKKSIKKSVTSMEVERMVDKEKWLVCKQQGMWQKNGSLTIVIDQNEM